MPLKTAVPFSVSPPTTMTMTMTALSAQNTNEENNRLVWKMLIGRLEGIFHWHIVSIVIKTIIKTISFFCAPESYSTFTDHVKRLSYSATSSTIRSTSSNGSNLGAIDGLFSLNSYFINLDSRNKVGDEFTLDPAIAA